MRKIFLLLLLLSLLLASCTTQKNTLFTRAYHNLTAHYNVYFNGKTALQEGIKTIEQKCQYNYYDILPIFPYECPDAKNLASSKMNRALEKAAKTIANHSITVKPRYRTLRNLTPAQLAFYKKYEYVKWIDDSYLLIGIANLYKGDITKSQQAFHRILDKYKDQNTVYDAKLWLAKSYILQGRFQDAYSQLTDLQKDEKHPKRLDKDINLTFADLFIHQKQYKKAIPYLEKAIKLEKNRALKAKYTFILAQLYLETGDKTNASLYFKKVSKYNPPYELNFHAQLYRATALGNKDNPEQIKKHLLKMLKDAKNEEYKDKIYYALAKLALQSGDTVTALKNFKKAVYNSSDQTQKGLTYLTLADLYFKQKNYILAGQYYDSTLNTLPQDYKDYKTIKIKSKSLIDLAKNLEIVHTQDSLQKLARLPKDKLYKIIDSIIQVKKQQQLAQKQTYNPTYDPLDMESQRYAAGLPTQQSQGGRWYFYNPMLVSKGKQIFRQKWGDRKLEDNWRRKVKSAVTENNFASEEQENKPSAKDLTSRDYYLKQIPLSDSAKTISNQKIIEALFNAALIYESKLNDTKQAISTFETLLNRFPDNKYTLDAYYHLYLLYKKSNNQTEANHYKQLIINNYPNSNYALMLKSPNYAKKMKQLELASQNLLFETIKLYNNFKYQAVIDSANKALKKYPGSSIIPNILFLRAKAYGSLGFKDSLENQLNYIIKNFPNSNITNLAKSLLTNLKSGTLNTDIYKFSPNDKYIFVLFVDNPKKINELKFNLFKLANEFSKNKVYTAQIDNIGKKQIIILKEFSNLTEATNFVQYFKANWQGKQQWFVFSTSNFETFKKDKDLLKYKLFYQKHYKF